ncbi:hypothetical protein BD289DRAFT_478095 [Coniella lustricola]|uniref:Uncharacterized protein n=1 Tax=Coniella lustricola TaxID=2025994 RepID=A0A2T3ANP0_9PEZI|nr:hypothetical protein BD289DRAFT_478095 [Coniella lustricola]
MAKITFDSIAKDNESLAGEIHALVSRSPLPAQQQAKNDGEDNGETDEGEENLKSLLRRLYGSICEFRDFRGYAATSDKKIIATWKSFLMPIRALAQMRPDGQMIAARMILYLGAAFPAASQLPRHLPRSTTAQNQVDLRFGLLIALDDALLECLTALWDRSHHRASFRWVFTHHSVSKTLCHVKCQCQIVPEDVQEDEEAMEKWAELRNSERFNTACLTRLCQLIPAHGVRGGYLWHRADGDTTKRSRDPDATQWSYEGDGEERLLKWQYIGSDGPIREDYQYDIIKSDVKPTQYDSRSRQLLRRSRQFVLDARRIAAVNLFKDRRVAAQCALARHFPAELQEYVLGHLDAHKPQEHPYLSKIDLSIAYASFPDIVYHYLEHAITRLSHTTPYWTSNLGTMQA